MEIHCLKGGCSGLSLWKKGFRARRVVLGPYVQYCPCEASEQKLEQKQKAGLKEIKLSYCQADPNWPIYPQKTPKTHQSGHISKPHFAQVLFTKKPTPTFFNDLSETFRIIVNMDFAHTNHGRFLI